MAAAPEPIPSAAPEKPGSSKARTFFRRLGSSIVLWSFVLAALFAGNLHVDGFNARLLADILFLVVMLVIAALGLEEFYELIEKAGYACFRGWFPLRSLPNFQMPLRHARQAARLTK